MYKTTLRELTKFDQISEIRQQISKNRLVIDGKATSNQIALGYTLRNNRAFQACMSKMKLTLNLWECLFQSFYFTAAVKGNPLNGQK